MTTTRLSYLSGYLFSLVFMPFVLFYSAPADGAARSCGSIVKNGKKTSIPCDKGQTQKTASNGRCHAQITFKGKTQNIRHNCPQKQSAPRSVVLTEPAGAFSKRQRRHKAMINELAKKYHVEAALIHAVVTVESAYRSDAVSHKGATGLMQLMPGTADFLRVKNPSDPRSNVDGGIRYLRAQIRRFKSMELALAAYNAGPETLVRYNNKIPPYAETQHYVKRVMAYRKRYQSDWKKHIK